MADEKDEVGPAIAYKDNPAWKDVQPIPQDDGPTPVVRIAYTEKCTVTRWHYSQTMRLSFIMISVVLDVYGYMRAVIKSGEKSERVLQLTADAIDCNPANYTVWYDNTDSECALECATVFYFYFFTSYYFICVFLH